MPDSDYPTDVISKKQLEEVVKGRGIKDLEGNLYENGMEADYVVWLYELITHNYGLLGGNLSSLERATNLALETTLLICATRRRCESIMLDDLRTEIFQPTGKDYTLSNLQTERLRMLLPNLPFCDLEYAEIRFNEIEVLQSIRARLAYQYRSAHIVSWEELRKL